VDDLDAVISAACTGPVDVFAASQAVPVAVAYAVRRPERVKRMVLYGGFVRGRTLRAGEAGDLDGDTALSMIRAGWGREGSVFMEAFIRMFAPDASPAMVAELARMQRETAEPDTVIRLRQTIDRFDVTDLLAQVVAPALVLHATGDVIQPFAQARALAAGLTDARLIPLDSRNHIALPDTQAWERLMAASEVVSRARWLKRPSGRQHVDQRRPHDPDHEGQRDRQPDGIEPADRTQQERRHAQPADKPHHRRLFRFPIHDTPSSGRECSADRHPRP
jgi:hypothetical protein